MAIVKLMCHSTESHCFTMSRENKMFFVQLSHACMAAQPSCEIWRFAML